MKKLIFSILLTASVWSSFSFAEQMTRVYSFSLKMGASTISSVREPFELYTPCAIGNEGIYFSTEQRLCEMYFIVENLTVTVDGQPRQLSVCLNPDKIQYAPYSCLDTGAYLKFSSAATTATEPSQTCKGLEGSFIDGFHNSFDDFCANIGTTGGANPEPLLCTATNISEIPAGSGNFQHTVTAQSCTAETGPTAPDDGGTDPEPPCTENCEPTEPETPPPSGNDGPDIPSTGGGANSSTTTVTGTQTDSQGNVTNISMTMEQDYTPVTSRQDETNQRLQAENQNSSTIIEQLNALGLGTAEISDKLDGVTDAINGIDVSSDMSGVEGKLDDIKGSIDGIKDGFGTASDGETAADGVTLPNYKTALDEGFDAIQQTINSPENEELTSDLSNLGDRLTAFESIPELFEFASENCAPIPWGQNMSLNLCPYAPDISNTLSWLFTVLTIIFLVVSVTADIKNIRMTS